MAPLTTIFRMSFLTRPCLSLQKPCGAGSAPGCTQHVKNALRRNDYGFTLGGPVVIPHVYNGKDKTFFFVNFEQFRQSTFTSYQYRDHADPGIPTGQLRPNSD